MSKIIEAIEQEQMSREVPDFAPGDTVVVHVKVSEGGRDRLQAFDVIAASTRRSRCGRFHTVKG
jgi:large subunit ribosomal protein L19